MLNKAAAHLNLIRACMVGLVSAVLTGSLPACFTSGDLVFV